MKTHLLWSLEIISQGFIKFPGFQYRGTLCFRQSILPCLGIVDYLEAKEYSWIPPSHSPLNVQCITWSLTRFRTFSSKTGDNYPTVLPVYWFWAFNCLWQQVREPPHQLTAVFTFYMRWPCDIFWMYQPSTCDVKWVGIRELNWGPILCPS